MPVPDLSNPNKQLSDLFKTWLPRITDPEYINSTKLGRMVNTASVMATPGIVLVGYGLGKVAGTKAGKEGIDALNAIPQAGFIDDLSRIGSRVHNIPDVLGAAAPVTFMPWLFKTSKNAKGIEEAVNYNSLNKGLEKFAQEASKLSGGKSRAEDLVDSAMSKILGIVDDPKLPIPKGVSNEEASQWLINNVGRKEIDRIAGVNRKVSDINTSESASMLEQLPSQLRNPEQAVLEAEKVVDKTRQAKVNTSSSIMDRILSPKMKAMFEGLQTRAKGSDVSKSLSEEGVDISRQSAEYYTKPETAQKIMSPVVKSVQSGLQSLDTPELGKLLTSQRKLLGPLDIDRTITTLTNRGIDKPTINLVRKYLMGTSPKYLTDHMNADTKRKTLLDINQAVEAIFDVYKKTGQ